MIKLVLILSILVSPTVCIPCSTQTVTTFPFNFTTDSLDVNQDCTYTFNYSTDEYLEIDLIFFGSNTPDDQIVISNSFGDKVQKSAYSSDWSYYQNQPPTQTTIQIKTGANNRPYLYLRVETFKFSLSNVRNANQYNVSSSPVIFSQDDRTLLANTSYTFTSTSKVAFSVVRYPFIYDTDSMTGIFIYEGQGATAKLLGTALSGNSVLYKNSWLSTGNVLTILATSSLVSNAYLIGNDAAYVEQYGMYDTTWCTRSLHEPQKTYRLNADNGTKPSAVTVGDLFEAHINDIAFSDPTATLTVLAGPPSAEKLQIIQYKHTDNVASQLPQKLPGTLRTFVLDKGYATINMSNRNGDDLWSYIRDGRNGMIWSPNYPYSTKYQDIRPVSFTQGVLNKTYVFNLTVLQSVSAPNARFVLQAEDGTKLNTINSTFASLYSSTMSVRGQRMNLSVDIGNYTTNGVAFHFQMTAVPSTAAGKGIVVLWLFILPLGQLIGF